MLLDTSAWIEFFLATEKGEKVKAILKKEENFTSIITISEVINWCLKQNFQHEKYLGWIKAGSKILDLDEDTAIIAGILNYERKKTIKNWGMADSIILSASKIYDLRIATTDHHFKDVQNVVLL